MGHNNKKILLSDLVANAHAAAREAVRELPPMNRGRLCRLAPFAETHFYAWLRGRDDALSAKNVDWILNNAELSYYFRIGVGLLFANRRTLVCGSGHRIAWALVDWRKSNQQIALAIGAAPETVSRNRKRYANRGPV